MNFFEKSPKWSKITKNGRGHKKAQFYPDLTGIHPNLCLSQDFEKIAIHGILGTFWTQNPKTPKPQNPMNRIKLSQIRILK